jgi:ribonuclease HII
MTHSKSPREGTKTAKHRRRRRRAVPSFAEEAALREQGYSFVAGLDEVGRGPLAGPVVAGVAILPPGLTGRWVRMVRDSKLLTPDERQQVLPHLRQVALGLEVGVSSSQEIDRWGIVAATRMAMERAIDALSIRPQFLLLDGLPISSLGVPQKAIVRGDALCLSIAAASIAAKVARDLMMCEEAATYPGYRFEEHKGYGTRGHLRVLERLGPCRIHRRSFAPIRVWDEAR